MTAKPGSVLCVLTSDGSFSLKIAHQAQKLALDHRLPLAVVYCVEEELLSDSPLAHYLKEVEAALAELHIPLITLVGDARTRVMGLSHHVHPLKVFMATPKDTQKPWISAFSDHKYPWPGVVVPLLEIIKLQNDPNIC